MKIKAGKYMFLGNINSMFGPGIRYANTIKGLKLKVYDKDDVKRGEASLFAVRNEKIVRINSNGLIW